MQPVFPRLGNPLILEDFGIYKMDPLQPIPDKKTFETKAAALCQFEKTYYQHLVSQYISQRTPYRSLLLYHGIGSGKTCSAITIAETFLTQHRLFDEPEVWIISKKALKKSFEQEVFQTVLLLTPEFLKEQCTGDTYYQLLPDHDKLSPEKITQRIQKIIKSRYQFYGYEKFANLITSYIEAGTLTEQIKNKLIIIDEAHNIRNLETGEAQKKIIEPLLQFIQMTQNNRLVLLTATPMFNEPEEILWLLSLLTLNDKHDHLLSPFHLPSLKNKDTLALIDKLSSYYISYVRGNNPFTFAIRVTPAQLNLPTLTEVPALTFQGQAIPKEERQWLSHIKDGLVPSLLSGVQLQNMEELYQQKIKLSTALLRQLNNITYIKQLTKTEQAFVEGKEGLAAVFVAKEGGGLQFEYKNPSEPILDPAYGKLQDYATKLFTLSQLLPKGKGLQVIYSNFIWGGLIPVAIMLEHMGMSRYGENNLLYGAATKGKPLLSGKYCILSGEEVMGGTTIDSLLKVINTTLEIKIVLMSPIASEGLTFKNAREMHILDPWYHLNTTEQAIGRAIRHCSHSSLPLEERNVSVFLHTTVFPGNERETEDLHAYRIAAMKQAEVEKIDKRIKEHALDCSLLQSYNYIPKELFQFQTFIKTSHNTILPFHYGDEEKDAITCKTNVRGLPRDVYARGLPRDIYARGLPRDVYARGLPRDVRAFREESYASFLPTLKKKLQKFLQQTTQTIFTYEELLSAIHPNREVAHRTIEQALYPNPLWNNYTLLYHLGKFILTQVQDTPLRTTRLQIEEIKESVEPSVCNLEKILENFALDPKPIATIRTYQALDSQCWRSFAEGYLLSPEKASSKIQPIIDILIEQGALLPERSAYVNIFAPEDKYEVFLMEEGRFREATDKELSQIMKERTYYPFPDPTKTKIIDTRGFIQRYKNPKEPDSPYRFQLKLGLNNEKVKRSGIVCETGLKKPEIEKELSKFTLLTGKQNMSQMCFSLMTELYKVGRLWMPPAYKKSDIYR